MLVEVEMMINSWPLTYLQDDVYEVLTPSHLFIGRRLLSKHNDVQINYAKIERGDFQKRLAYIKQLLDHYFIRFQNEYLTELRQHHAYVKDRNSNCKKMVNKGDMVLIHDEEFKPRISWRRGVIDESIKGKDGQTRGVTLRVYKDGKHRILKDR